MTSRPPDRDDNHNSCQGEPLPRLQPQMKMQMQMHTHPAPGLKMNATPAQSELRSCFAPSKQQLQLQHQLQGSRSKDQPPLAPRDRSPLRHLAPKHGTIHSASEAAAAAPVAEAEAEACNWPQLQLQPQASSSPSLYASRVHNPIDLGQLQLLRTDSNCSEQMSTSADDQLRAAAKRARMRSTQLARQSSSPAGPAGPDLEANCTLATLATTGSASESVPAACAALASSPVNLLQLVHSLGDCLQLCKQRCQSPDLSLIRSLMVRFDTSLNEWRRFMTVNPAKQYTRNLIATDNSTFTLMLLVWNPHSGSMIHSHSSSECFMKVCQGSVTESQYENLAFGTPNQVVDDGETPVRLINHQLRLKQCVRSEVGQVLFINDSIGLHRIDNSLSDAVSVTLHLYVPPYQSSLCYAVKENDTIISITKGQLTFDSEGGAANQH